MEGGVWIPGRTLASRLYPSLLSISTSNHPPSLSLSLSPSSFSFFPVVSRSLAQVRRRRRGEGGRKEKREEREMVQKRNRETAGGALPLSLSLYHFVCSVVCMHARLVSLLSLPISTCLVPQVEGFFFHFFFFLPSSTFSSSSLPRPSSSS